MNDEPSAGHGSMGRAIYTEIQLKSVGMHLKSEQKMHQLWNEDVCIMHNYVEWVDEILQETFYFHRIF